MRTLLTTAFAGRALAILLALVIIFHLAILADVVPQYLVWGGQERSPGQLLALELLSIIINALMLVITLMRIDLISQKLNKRT